MDFHLLNHRPTVDPDYCILDDFPEGLGLDSYKLGKGERVGKDYPKNARIYMTDDFSGIALPDLVSNTRNMLIVSKKVKESIERVNKGPTEYLPVAIYNHKRRLASADYFIINPLGTFDCLDLKKSRIEYHEGDVVGVDEFVLDPKKLKKAPDLFRAREDPVAYFVSERLIGEWLDMEPRPTNIHFVDLDKV
ncbi:imm11 family protein [Pyxidicoccus caerfyrddinensis]|uniref:imm11 family protein n=1 Tax=Pyxidicoccus caerfyrddinensis TaxID=2709663 RepID=UPI0013DB4082|nr:DUF1629 domain-containing protein [Pyxidicoccus caerfyrddinensis]